MPILAILLTFIFVSTSNSPAWAKSKPKKAKRVHVTFSDSDPNEGVLDLRKFSSGDLSSSVDPLSAAARRWLRLDDSKVQSIDDEIESEEVLDQDLE